MAGGAIDNILSFVVPIIVFGILLLTIYKGFQKPIDDLIAKIKEWIYGAPDTPQSYNFNTRKNFGIEGGDIRYSR